MQLAQDLAADVDLHKKPKPDATVTRIENGTETSEQDQKWYFLPSKL